MQLIGVNCFEEMYEAIFTVVILLNNANQRMKNITLQEFLAKTYRQIDVKIFYLIQHWNYIITVFIGE